MRPVGVAELLAEADVEPAPEDASQQRGHHVDLVEARVEPGYADEPDPQLALHRTRAIDQDDAAAPGGLGLDLAVARAASLPVTQALLCGAKDGIRVECAGDDEVRAARPGVRRGVGSDVLKGKPPSPLRASSARRV